MDKKVLLLKANRIDNDTSELLDQLLTELKDNPTMDEFIHISTQICYLKTRIRLLTEIYFETPAMLNLMKSLGINVQDEKELVKELLDSRKKL